MKKDVEWFEKCVKRVISEDIGEEFVQYVDENLYFTDFMR